MRVLTYLSALILLASCGVIRNTPKFGLQDGVYELNKQPVFIENLEDTLLISTTKGAFIQALPTIISKNQNLITFQKSTFDVDVLAIPVKFRASQSAIPTQLTSEINGALYVGKRKDYFQISYHKTPTNRFKRTLDHYGFSVGGFVGLGNSLVNSDLSQGKIVNEYQGITFSKGIAGIIAINNFTLGVAYGFDQLLDSNASNWIYNQKSWVGLALGLNLN